MVINGVQCNGMHALGTRLGFPFSYHFLMSLSAGRTSLPDLAYSDLAWRFISTLALCFSYMVHKSYWRFPLHVLRGTNAGPASLRDLSALQ